MSATSLQPKTKVRVTLWIAQSLLTALYLFAGSMKFIMPVEAMTQQMPVPLPVWFIHFIGVAEICGAVGLVLPTLLRIRPELTPLAAAGLIVIMAGAVVLSAMIALSAAVMPFVAGLLLVFVAYGRTHLAPVASRQIHTRFRAPAPETLNYAIR